MRTRWHINDDNQLQLACEVTDTGIGISSEQLALMFAPFQQGDSSTSRRFAGIGLGLSIARNLADKMGGDLQAASQPGKGSRFVLRVPLALAGDESTPALL